MGKPMVDLGVAQERFNKAKANHLAKWKLRNSTQIAANRAAKTENDARTLMNATRETMINAVHTEANSNE